MIRYKYPRTPHLPWSPGNTHDDIFLVNTNVFKGQYVVVTEKMDGENTTIYQDYTHARSVNSANHSSRSWVKALQAKLSSDIPDNWRLCGENLFAQHSIAYENLESYFYLFAIFNDQNVCLSWQETREWASLLSLPLPHVLFEGFYDEEVIKNIELNTDQSEGYVVRLSNSFHYDAMGQSLGKWVRTNHVQTDTHWLHAEIKMNGLRRDS
ncbi:MAG: RNA ligase family protein [Lentisphaerales bacterium]|nr:RNA ligase family protein [Lentisphaerales bacterium]